MHFKKLELIGFKSFSERTKLYFEPGITTIVGPNGCGKSNIIDAIKWVLGEQSVKSLRGSKMEDVIFSGTDETEPINMAEVSLTLSNKDKLLPIDADEVVVSRKLFRSGESEYLINKTPVRLKDVSELFMGTGIGAEAYSMIEQGKIDLILSSRPEERRFIFEEASGITKYKSKKKEAIRKLEATDNNLLRVSDIISEVKRQINSITRQASKAERYKERFERLKDIETKLASYEYDTLKQEKVEIEAESTKAIDEISSMSTEMERLQRELESEKDSLTKIDEKFTEMQSRKISGESKIEQDMSRIDVNREWIAELSVRVNSLRDEIGSIDKRRKNSEILLQELENKFSAVSDDEEAKKIFLEEKEKRLEELESGIKRSGKDMEESRQRLVGYMAERSRARNEIVRLTSDIQNRSVRLRRLNIELDKVKDEAGLIEKKLIETRKEFKDIESALSNTRFDADKLKECREEQLLSLDSLEDELKRRVEVLIALESKKSFLEDLIDRHEGFTGGAKALLESLKRGDLKIDGIKGVLGDMVEAVKGCEIAVEAALGNYVQCIVSEDGEGALKAIQYLSANKKGHATFIISSELSMDEEMDTSALSLDGIQGKLTDFVDARDELKGVIGNLLKKTYLVATMEAARKILNNLDIDNEIRLVTTRGEILKRGFVTAGSSPESEDTSIIGRRARLKDTIDELKSSKSAITKMEKEREELNEKIAQFDKKLTTVYNLLKEEEARFHKKESELASVEQENSRLEEELSILKLETDEVTEETKELSEMKNGLEKSLSDIESEENNTQSVILNLQETVKEFSKEREETIVLIAEIKTELQAISKEQTSLSRSLEVQRDLFQTYTDSLKQKQNEIDASEKRKDELTQEIEELEIEISKLSGEVKLMDEELVQIGMSKKKNLSVIEDSEKRFNYLYKAFDGRKDAEHKMEMRNSEVSFKMETLKNRITQMYKVDMGVTKLEYDSSTDWETARKEIEELKRRLESMGTVNLVAIEERKELEDRFNFLNHQQEDLLKAKESLQIAITKINKTTRRLFIETFEKIQFEFKNYFRYLFGGGQAEIYLLDEHDVLESGIEIAVRPPGKKLQSISLLSGGEKALTAIALIFAVFKVKPSPFCLLDEVDAPLDESNIERFSKALRDFTKKSQFIVITHNKRTITLADVMYGITMERSGISKIVSVKFHDEAMAKKATSDKTGDEKEEEVLT